MGILRFPNIKTAKGGVRYSDEPGAVGRTRPTKLDSAALKPPMFFGQPAMGNGMWGISGTCPAD